MLLPPSSILELMNKIVIFDKFKKVDYTDCCQNTIKSSLFELRQSPLNAI